MKIVSATLGYYIRHETHVATKLGSEIVGKQSIFLHNIQWDNLSGPGLIRFIIIAAVEKKAATLRALPVECKTDASADTCRCCPSTEGYKVVWVSGERR